MRLIPGITAMLEARDKPARFPDTLSDIAEIMLERPWRSQAAIIAAVAYHPAPLPDEFFRPTPLNQDFDRCERCGEGPGIWSVLDRKVDQATCLCGWSVWRRERDYDRMITAPSRVRPFDPVVRLVDSDYVIP